MNRRAFLSLSGAAVAAASAPCLVSRRPAATASRRSRPSSAPRWPSTACPASAWASWHDQRLHVRGFGVTSLDDPRPITGDTLFTIASISKTMTATAVMRLVEDGRLDLRAPVHAVLPEFRVRDQAASEQVTPWHLLTHTPGLGRAADDRRPRRRGPGALRLDDHADAAATGRAGRGLELQQRRVRAVGTAHRGRDRARHPRRAARAGVRAARADPHVHAAHRRAHLSD